ncbi:hypothetical protein GE09DRAFT_1137891 [Coniochaeta sp. 2T2.1]|nr:hypothetical protein GE09DRAFT_1137891 [Coniochaeta sp. 2T2.1]
MGRPSSKPSGPSSSQSRANRNNKNYIDPNDPYGLNKPTKPREPRTLEDLKKLPNMLSARDTLSLSPVLNGPGLCDLRLSAAKKRRTEEPDNAPADQIPSSPCARTLAASGKSNNIPGSVASSQSSQPSVPSSLRDSGYLDDTPATDASLQPSSKAASTQDGDSGFHDAVSDIAPTILADDEFHDAVDDPTILADIKKGNIIRLPESSGVAPTKTYRASALSIAAASYGDNAVESGVRVPTPEFRDSEQDDPPVEQTKRGKDKAPAGTPVKSNSAKRRVRDTDGTTGPPQKQVKVTASAGQVTENSKRKARHARDSENTVAVAPEQDKTKTSAWTAVNNNSKADQGRQVGSQEQQPPVMADADKNQEAPNHGNNGYPRAIIKKHRINRKDDVELWVKWDSGDNRGPSWELEEDIHEKDQAALAAYWEKQPGGRLKFRPYEVFAIKGHHWLFKGKSAKKTLHLEMEWTGYMATSMEPWRKFNSDQPQMVRDYWLSIGGRPLFAPSE